MPLIPSPVCELVTRPLMLPAKAAGAGEVVDGEGLDAFVTAIEAAKRKRAVHRSLRIGMNASGPGNNTSDSGRQAKTPADYCLCIPSDTIPRPEEMRLTTLARLGLTGNPWLLRRSATDSLRWRHHWGFQAGSEAHTRGYLNAVLGWIGRAQDACAGGGVAARYDLVARKFLAPYPETTGYLIPSLLDAAGVLGSASQADRARRASDWLVSRQMPDGSIDCGLTEAPAPAGRQTVILFDCGAVLQGFVAMYRHSRADIYAGAADRLARFMASCQRPSGEWDTHLYFPYFGSHNALVGYALITAGQALERTEYVDAGTRCLNAIRPNVMANGHIKGCHFTASANGTAAFLHPLAYTVEGFLRSSVLLGDSRFFDTIGPTLGALQRRFEIGRSMLASHYDQRWRAVTRYSALDADCQISMLWFLFSRATGDLRFANSALKMMDLVRHRIDTTAGPEGARGGLPGSFPIHGDNQRHACINWAPKYFIDASLLELAFRRRLEA
jgi:hypothetical protein